MLANLPHKIPVPFNLLGDETKLAFRSQPGGIVKLATSRVRAFMIQHLLDLKRLLFVSTSRRPNRIGTRCVDIQGLCMQTALMRSQYVTLFDSASDVFTLISHNDGACVIEIMRGLMYCLTICRSPPRTI